MSMLNLNINYNLPEIFGNLHSRGLIFKSSATIIELTCLVGERTTDWKVYSSAVLREKLNTKKR
jgi:hypothetical protein